jgi:hypothetical protein
MFSAKHIKGDVIMIKVIDKNCICLIGKVDEIKLQLASVKNMNITLAEYLKMQSIAFKNSLN